MHSRSSRVVGALAIVLLLSGPQVFAESASRSVPAFVLYGFEYRQGGVVSPAAKKPFLVPREGITIAVRDDIIPDPSGFAHPHLLMRDDTYRDDIIAHAKPVKAGTKFRVNIHTVDRSADNKQVENALPEKHFFDFDKHNIYAIIERLIAMQPLGRSDTMYLDKINLFYTSNRVVCVFQGDEDTRWEIGVWRRDNLPKVWWDAGTQVFSPG